VIALQRSGCGPKPMERSGPGARLALQRWRHLSTTAVKILDHGAASTPSRSTDEAVRSIALIDSRRDDKVPPRLATRTAAASRSKIALARPDRVASMVLYERVGISPATAAR